MYASCIRLENLRHGSEEWENIPEIVREAVFALVTDSRSSNKSLLELRRNVGASAASLEYKRSHQQYFEDPESQIEILNRRIQSLSQKLTLKADVVQVNQALAVKANLSDVKNSPNLEHVPFERVEAAHHSLSEQIFKHERDVTRV